jgi:arylsulfatase A-like enzyme
MNVMLISLDCVRVDKLGCYGGDTNTPTMDALAEKGVCFENCIVQAPFTTPSHVSLLTGLYPFRHSVRLLVAQKLAPNIQTLPRILQKRGYFCGGFPSVFLMETRLGLDRGFDIYDDQIETERIGFRGPWRPGKLTTARVLSFLNDVEKDPFFAFVHYFDPHDYDPGKLGGERRYNALIEKTDGFVGEILGKLSELELLEDTLVVVTADHGDAFGEHLHFGHGKDLYDPVLRVPLIIAGPGIPKGKVIQQQVRQIDIMPTVLDLLDFNIDVHIDGVSLNPIIHGQYLDLVAYSETSPVQLFEGDKTKLKEFSEPEVQSIRTNDWKYIRHQVRVEQNRKWSLRSIIRGLWVKGQKVIGYPQYRKYLLKRLFLSSKASENGDELYNLSFDPDESQNLAFSYSSQLENMRRIMRNIINSDRQVSSSLIQSEEDEKEIIQRLEDLGYL